MARPVVSVFMISYNHAPYLAQALESVLAQDVDFTYEIVIGDDASTDDTPEIIRRYQQQYPQILAILRERNVGAMPNVVDLYTHCQGEYIAVLEGDDYWTDRTKLRRQIAALAEHADWAMCFHRVEHVDATGASLQHCFPERVPAPYDFAAVVGENCVPTCSMVWRRALFPSYPAAFCDLSLGDWPLCMLLAEQGTLGYLPQVMAAYRVHHAGAWTQQTTPSKEKRVLQMLLALQDLVRPEHVPLVRERIQFMFDHYCQHALALEQSLSWRLTAPLRGAANVASRLVAGLGDTPHRPGDNSATTGNS